MDEINLIGKLEALQRRELDSSRPNMGYITALDQRIAEEERRVIALIEHGQVKR